MRTAPLALLLVLHLAFAPSSGATTADAVCSPAANPCTVTAMIVVDDGSTLDFGARDLVLEKHGKLNAMAGSMTINAHNVTLEDGSFLQAVSLSGFGGDITVEATGDITLQQGSAIDVSGAPGGDITLDAAGAVVIVGDLKVNGINGDDGGTITVSAGTVSMATSGDVLAAGDGDGLGGDVEIDATSNLNLAGTIDVQGGFNGGGSLSLTTFAGNTALSGDVRAQSQSGGGDGGSVSIDGAGSVSLGGTFRIAGDGGGDGGGFGGDLDVSAGGALVIRASVIDVTGATPDGDGGTAFVTAGTDLTLGSSVTVQAQSRGAEGTGGLVDFSAGGNLDLPSVDASGGDPGGGGGSVSATACGTLSLKAGQVINAAGPTGDTTLTASGQMTVAGKLVAGQSNTLQFLSGAPQPVLTGSNIAPQPVLTAVTSVPGCIGPGCGNGVPDAGEECDDGNTVSCDGCSRMCKKESGTCGDGTLNPECEACDDGNTVDCDGCKGDCSRPDDVCGDGIVECGEDGDVGDTTPCDGLSATCKFETCGNDVAECNEQCDAGPSGSPSCSTSCTLLKPPHCGDGVVQTDEGEACDDGNAVDCDGCSTLCQFDGCGSGEVDAACGEQCDDGNTRGGDGCSAICHVEVCGNGLVDAGEQCDDGNTNECDGCKSDCTLQTAACPVCVAGSTEPCIPCTGAIDCDPLQACGSAACIAGVCTPVNPPNCDDGNACTVDTCDPARGCVHAPVACGDTTACDGLQSCDPTSGQCVNGPAPNCDDDDACTDDSCTETTPGFVCVHQLQPGVAGARCRLTTLQSLIDSANDIPKGTRKKLRGLVKKVMKKLPAAAGSGKKAARAHKQVANGLKALTRAVTKAERKIGPGTVGQLNAAITNAMVAVGNL